MSNLVFTPIKDCLLKNSINYYIEIKFFKKVNDFKTYGIKLDNISKLQNKLKIKDKYNQAGFNILIKHLNNEKLIGKKYSNIYWQIILGHWYETFLDLYIERYDNLEEIFNNYKFNTISLIKNSNEHIEQDYSSDTFTNCKSSTWNYCLYQHIYKNSFMNQDHKFNEYDVHINHDSNKKRNFKFKSKIIFLYNKFISYLNTFKKSQFIIMNTYASKMKDLFIQIKLGQFPYYWSNSLYNNFYLKKNYDIKTRNKIKSNINSEQHDINIKKFLETLIYFLPTAYLENFQKINKIQSKIFCVRKPFLIFTSSNYAFDDIFKRFLAINKTVHNSIIVIGQHGYGFPIEIDNSYGGISRCELKFTDYYLTWGNYNKKYQDKIKTACVLSNRKFIKNYKENFNKEYIVLMQPDMALYELFNTKTEYLKHLNDIKYYLGDINIKDVKKIFIKFHNSELENLEIVNLWKKKLLKYYPHIRSNISINYEENEVQEIYDNTKLYIFNYTSTGFLECMSKNIPAIIFDPNFKNSQDFANIPILEKLCINKIVFTNKEEMRIFITSNCDDLKKWWLNKEVQKTVFEFSELFAKKHNHSTIVEIIHRITNENKKAH
ncbi:hypothetical protein N9751_02115 [Alphaproteobacteria bacterium]|nr:hypothetical protein [Alphaproteobacteria bacterium]